VRSRLLILVAVFLGVLALLAGGVYAYDRSQDDTIANGIRVDGVDLSGLSAQQARAKLDRVLLAPLRAPITVHLGSRTWHLGPREARIAADLDTTVQQALARSREGNILSRTVRELTGGRVNDQLSARVTYSKAAVVRLVDRVRRAAVRPAQNATIHIDGSGIATTPSHDGVQLDAHRLHAQIVRAIVSPSAPRSFTAGTHDVVPKMTTAKVEQDYNTVLIVRRSQFTLSLYKDLKLKKTYEIAVGMQGLETPAGLYHIQNKAINPAWTVPMSKWTGKLAGHVIPGGAPNNPLKARWLGIFDGAGIHGIDPSEYGTIGHAASHGCVRMRIPDVIDLYPQVPVGAPIYIA
jgi:L,D-transpeptidase catalytic domain/Putative peptidoglycan binding domain